MDRLIEYARERLKLDRSRWFSQATTTSFPTALDARNPAAWTNDALFLPQTREKFRTLTNLGLTDAVRAGSDAGRAVHLLGLSGGRLEQE